MKMMAKKLKKYTLVAIFCILVIGIFLQISSATNNILTSKVSNYHASWIIDSELDDPSKWNFTESREGLVQDIGWNMLGGQANLNVIGDSYQSSISLNSSTYNDWIAFNKTENVVIPINPSGLPSYDVDNFGAWVSHSWHEEDGGEQPKNTPRMHWKYNVSLPVDMSDYEITSASLIAEINGTVDQNIDTPGDTQAEWSPDGFINGQYQQYDWAQFYIELSNLDLDEINTYRIAFNQTETLGNENLLQYTIDGLIQSFSEQAIIDALTNVLAVDSGNNDFVIIIGIYMYCEDNQFNTDEDDWIELRFKSLDLTFTYEKKIDKSSSVTLSQTGNMKTGENVTITGANLKFKYKIDQDWTNESEFSELRIYINDNKFEESIRLSEYSTPDVFVDAATNGFELGYIVPKDVNITLSIQLYLANTFNLDSDIIVSIDAVYLELYWQEIVSDPVNPIVQLLEEPWFYTALFILVSAGLMGLGSWFAYYYRVGRYPIPVRKVRKYRKSLNKENAPKNVRIISRDTMFEHKYGAETKVISKDLKDASLGKKIKQSVLLGEFNKYIDDQK